MMDQILAGLPQAHQPVQPAFRDQQASADSRGTENSDSFEDFVSRASQNDQPDQRDAAASDGVPGDDAQAAADARKGTTDVVDKPGRGRQDAAESRIRLALLNQSQHARRREEQDAQGNEAVDAALSRDATGSKTSTGTVVDTAHRNAPGGAEDRIRLALSKVNHKATDAEKTGKTADSASVQAKLLDAAKLAARKAALDEAAAPAVQDVAATPSEELSLLLGLKPGKETSAKHDGKRDSDSDADKVDAKDEKIASSIDRKAETSLAGAGNAEPVKGGNNVRTKDDADTAVRLVNADGKGRPVDIPMMKTGSDGVADTDRRQNAAKIDTATVIEARRYLGFSPDANVATLTDAIKSDTTWTEALSHVNRAELALEGDTINEVNTLKLQMSPGDLGSMVASLKLKGDELTVEVRVDTIEAYRQLSADQDSIVQALQDQGFSIDTVTVQLNPASRPDAGADSDWARQGQRDGQDNQAGRNDNARQGAQHSWTRNDDAGNATTAGGNPDSARSGDIYL